MIDVWELGIIIAEEFSVVGNWTEVAVGVTFVVVLTLEESPLCDVLGLEEVSSDVVIMTLR